VAGHDQATCRGNRLPQGPFKASRTRPPRKGQLPATRAVASKHCRSRAWMAPTEARPLGMALARKGGASGHNARRSYRSRGSGTQHSHCSHWMRVEGEG
ncbi:hypothetical protein GW17_00055236, partial [Ensete ventricosum]